MSAFEVGAGERVLFALCHPDDEMAVIAFMRRLRATGIPVRVTWSHSTPIRQEESTAVMERIGIDESALTFFGAPDKGITEGLQELRERMGAVVGSFKPTRVVTHAFEQGHLDHDATNLLVNLCFNGPVYEAPYYHTYMTKFPVINRFSDPLDEECIDLSREEQAFKRSLIEMYPSQTIARNVRAYEFFHALTMRKARMFERERLRLQTHKDFLTPNHPPALAGRVAQSEPWAAWVRAVAEVAEPTV